MHEGEPPGISGIVVMYTLRKRKFAGHIGSKTHRYKDGSTQNIPLSGLRLVAQIPASTVQPRSNAAPPLAPPAVILSTLLHLAYDPSLHAPVSVGIKALLRKLE